MQETKEISNNSKELAKNDISNKRINKKGIKNNKVFLKITEKLSLIKAILKEKASFLLSKILEVIKSNFFIGFFTIFLCNFFFLSGMETTLDLTLGQGSISLVNAFKLSSHDIMNLGANSGYIYTLFLKFLSLFSVDIIDTYYFNILALSTISTLAIYTYCFLITKKIINSMLISFIWMIGCFNTSLYEKDSLLTLSFLLIGFIISEFTNSKSLKFIVISIFLFFASYVNEAYLISFFIAFIIGLVLVLKDYKNNKKEMAVISVITIILLIAYNHGLPIFTDKEESFIRTFKECFFINWQKWQEISIASKIYDLDYKENVWLSTFGDTDNIFKAFLASPLTLFHHLFTNLLNMIKVLGLNLFFHYPVFIPTNSYRSIVTEGMIFIIAFVLLLGGAMEHYKTRTTIFKNHGFRVVFWGATLISPLISGILFYPYPHYIVQLGCFFLIFGSIMIAEMLVNMELFFYNDKKSLVIFSFCLLCVIPRVHTMPPQTDILVNPSRIFGKSYATLPIKETVSFIKSLEFTQKIKVYSIEEQYINYLPDNFSLAEVGKESFKNILNNKSVDMVIETSGFATSPKDKNLIQFLKNPEKYGYFAITVPGLSENRIIVKQGINCKKPYCDIKIEPTPENIEEGL